MVPRPSFLLASKKGNPTANSPRLLHESTLEYIKPPRKFQVLIFPIDLRFLFNRPASTLIMFKSSWGLEEQHHHMQTYEDRPISRIPPEAAGIVHVLKDKSVSELQKLLSNKDAYQQFLLSLDMVQTQIRLKEELRGETMQLAKHNLEKEPHIKELRNQCQIIRATELAAAWEKLNELEKQKQEILRFYSPASLLHRLQESMQNTEEESEALHQQLLDREIDLNAFVYKYKRLRNTYHKRALTHLATNTSLVG